MTSSESTPPRDRDERRLARRDWPVVKRTLESGEDAGPPETTAEERLAMVWGLTLEAWSLAGQLQPAPPRHALPVRRTTLAAADP